MEQDKWQTTTISVAPGPTECVTSSLLAILLRFGVISEPASQGSKTLKTTSAFPFVAERVNLGMNVDMDECGGRRRDGRGGVLAREPNPS
jgi:hypothetical protein